MRKRRSSIIAIDLLRVMAAAIVVAYHFCAAAPRYPAASIRAMMPALPVPPLVSHAIWWGWVGVEIFFVISGLVIATSAAGSTPGPFLRRRALRLFPAVWICGTATLVAVRIVAPGAPVWSGWAESMLLLPTAAPIDPSYWTLSIELGFYALVAAVLTGGGEPARLERAAMWLGAASMAFWATAGLAGGGRLADDFTFQLTLLPHGCLFAAGVLIASQWQTLGQARGQKPASRGRVVMLAGLLATGGVEIAHRAGLIAQVLQLQVSVWTPVAAYAAAMATVLAAPRLQPWLANRIGARAAARAGAATYPLYLVHQVAGIAVAVTLVRAGASWPVALLGAAVAAVTFACAVAWLVEPAIRRALTSFIPRVGSLESQRRAFSFRRGPGPDTRPSASPPAG